MLQQLLDNRIYRMLDRTSRYLSKAGSQPAVARRQTCIRLRVRGGESVNETEDREWEEIDFSYHRRHRG